MPFGFPPRELFRTLRFRLTLWVTVVVTLMVALTLLAVRQVALGRLQEDFDEVLVEDTTEIGLAVKELYPREFDRLVQALERRVIGHAHRGWFVELYDARHRLLWASPNVPELPPPRFPPRGRKLVDVGDYRLIEARLSAPDGTALFVRSGAGRGPLQSDIDLLNRIMLLACTLIVFLAPLGGFLLAGRAMRPIAWIIATTTRLHPHRLDERLPIRGSGDELDQLSQTINGMLDRIARYLEQNREFVANAAHELRSPLAAIRSSVEVALNRSRTPEEYTTLLTDVMEECTRLSNLINRLLLLAEGDAGRLSGRGQIARLDEVVRQSVDMFEAVAESEGVALTAGPLPPAPVTGDESHLRQVVRNLLDNAIKFSPPPGEVRIELEADPARPEVVLTVRDKGVGIPPDLLPRVFERFYRVDKSRHRTAAPGGHGLGLSICAAIVTGLGGTIEVKSELGQGSTFTVRLPRAAEPPPAAATEMVADARRGDRVVP